MEWCEEREVLKRRVRGLERALERASRAVAIAEARGRELETCLLEERTRASQLVETARKQCVADAIDVAVDVVKSQSKSVLPSAAVHARRLVAHHGDAVEDCGAPLKETLVCVFHSHGQSPPISPAEALPAALACVDFAARIAPALVHETENDVHTLKGHLDGVFTRVKTNLLHGVTDRIRSRAANPFLGEDDDDDEDDEYTSIASGGEVPNNLLVSDDAQDQLPDADPNRDVPVNSRRSSGSTVS